MRKNRYILLILAFILVIAGKENLFALDTNTILQKLKELNVEVTGPSNSTEFQLKDKLDDIYWGTVEKICKNDGWDLSEYAGKKVLITIFPTKEEFKGTPVYVQVLSFGEKIIGMFKTSSCPSGCVPPLWSVKNSRKSEIKQ